MTFQSKIAKLLAFFLFLFGLATGFGFLQIIEIKDPSIHVWISAISGFLLCVGSFIMSAIFFTK